MPEAGERVTARELAALVAGACLLAVVMHWPLVLHLGENIPKDLGDPLPQSWQVAWDGHSLGHQPLDFFQSNQFWPWRTRSPSPTRWWATRRRGSSDRALRRRCSAMTWSSCSPTRWRSWAPTCWRGSSGWAAGGAAVAGAAFAFAPFRLEQDGHMHVISSGGIPLAFALGLRGYRLRRPAWVVAGWAVAAWQLSLGFTLGLPLAYLLAAVWLIVAVFGFARGVRAAREGWRSPPSWARRSSSRPGCCSAGRTSGWPTRTPRRNGRPRTWLRSPAPRGSSWWRPTRTWPGAAPPRRSRDGLGNIPEKTLFPGLAILALAVAGLSSAAYPRWLRRGLGVGVLAVMVLALGFRESGGLAWPYRVVYELVPGWQAIRVPGRLVTFSSLGLALLAGAGAQRAMLGGAARRLSRMGGADRDRRRCWLPRS